ncbi:MAG: hypothetical protein AB7I38_09775 [Dehalococcoidia bacterium]
MNHYLVIAHRTAASPELASCLTRLVAADPRAALTLLVTATHGPLEEHSEAVSRHARQLADDARATLAAAGVYLVAALIGAGSPFVAAQDELREHPDVYDAVILLTRPPRLLGRLATNVRARIEAESGLPVLHAHRGWLEPWRDGRQRPPDRLARLWRRTRLEERREPGQPFLRPTPPKARDLLPVVALMLCYLAGGLTLALTVNRAFYLNDAVAIVVYTVVIGGLLLVMRSES